jgi:hypothetical protein
MPADGIALSQSGHWPPLLEILPSPKHLYANGVDKEIRLTGGEPLFKGTGSSPTPFFGTEVSPLPQTVFWSIDI